MYSLISITGLALGMTSCILIILYVKQELNYDQFHSQAERIYRLAVETTRAEGTDRTAGTPIPVAPAFALDFPEIESVVRIYEQSDTLVRIDNNRFVEEGFIYADPDFFKMFSFPLVKGNPDNLLNDPRSIVISSSLAKKYFGDKDPIDRILRVSRTQEYSISGVFEDVPTASHYYNHADHRGSVDQSTASFPANG